MDVDVVYWINLEKNVERKNHMLQLFKNGEFKMPCIRINAMTDDKVSNYIKKDHDILSVNFKVTNKQYACLVSHLNAYKEFINSPYETALILEDDASLDLMPYWKTSLSEAMEHAPKNWEILKLTTYKVNKQLYTPWTSPKCFKRKNCIDDWSTLAYVINKPAAKKIMKRLLKNDKYVFKNDTYHVADYLLYDYLKTYVYKYPFFIVRKNNVSNITGGDQVAVKNTRRRIMNLLKTRKQFFLK
jgi:GR25 family glycosyltransferase involved in LPS biosynthesis